MTTIIDRADAVAIIAGHLADRDAFLLVGVAPDTLAEFIDALHQIPHWTAYVDNGTPLTARTSDWRVLTVTNMIAPAAITVTVPKTVPATVIGDALGHTVPADGSQDLIVLQAEGGPIHWPLLFIEAMDRVDPKTAAAIRAMDVALAN